MGVTEAGPFCDQEVIMAATTNRIREHSVKEGGRDMHEGKVTHRTDSLTARIPSIAFLTASAVSIAASATLQAKGNQRLSLFVGQWAPTFLILGLYNKLVKVAGSD